MHADAKVELETPICVRSDLDFPCDLVDVDATILSRTPYPQIFLHFLEIECPGRSTLGISLMTTSRGANVSLFQIKGQNDATVDDFEFRIGKFGKS